MWPPIVGNPDEVIKAFLLLEAIGTPLSVLIAVGRPKSLNALSKMVKAKSERVEATPSQVIR